MAQGISVRGSWGKLLGFAEFAAALYVSLIKATDSHLRLPLCVCTCVRYLCHAPVIPDRNGEKHYPGLEEAEEGALPGWIILGFKEVGKKKKIITAP